MSITERELIMANFNYYKRRVKQFTLTEWLIGANVIMYLLTMLVNMTIGNGLLHLGAKVNYLIAGGQYFRLFTAMFLHADIMHLVFNMLALYILGKDIERFFGKKKFLAIYFGAGFMGSALSYLMISSTSVGASGAIFGLMGANLFLYKKNPIVYKRIYGNDLLILIGINVVIGFVRPNIDIAGHIGGLMAGFLIAMAIGLKSEKWLKAKSLIYVVLVATITFGSIAIATYQSYQSANFYLTMSAYHYQLNNLDKMAEWANRGLEKFPTNEQLLTLKGMIQ